MAIRNGATPRPAGPRNRFGGLFDFSFSRILTPRLVPLLYALAILWAALVGLSTLYYSWQAGCGLHNIIPGIFLLAAGPLYFVVIVVCARVALELVLALFQMRADLRSLASGERQE